MEKTHSQFALLSSRRFLPFFLTQFGGAFNDNVFKNSLMLLLAFHAGHMSGADAASLVNLAAGLFILPFFLFSATAGQLADKFEKTRIIRLVKLAEILFMAMAAIGFYSHSIPLLIAVLFLMGMHSTFFGPIKYSIMPQHLQEHELVGGNALVEMGTFVSILLGTLLAGILAPLPDAPFWISIAVLSVAVMGYLSSRFIPQAASNPELVLNLNPVTQTIATLKQAHANRSVWLAMLGISWFWFLGASYLTQFPHYTREVLGGSESVVTLLLSLFSIGIAVGSLLCERLSGHKLEIGLVPLGSIGLSLFGIDLYFASTALPAPEATLRDASAFWALPGAEYVLGNLFLLGIFGGFYIVPLFAMVQTRSAPDARSRMIAANNILNALFMVGSAILGMVLLGRLQVSIPVFFLLIAIGNIVVAGFIYSLVPEFTLRFLFWMITHTVYRVRHEGQQHIPEQGAAVIVCNHVSYVDALLLATSSRRPVRFVMYKPIYEAPGLNWLFRAAGTIPICGQHEDKATYDAAFEKISAYLQAGELVCIFPEGKLTRSGEMNEFRKGIELIVARDPVPVIPMALRGLWGSFFSNRNNQALRSPFRRLWSRITMVAGPAIAPTEVTAERLYDEVMALRGDEM